MKNDSTLLRFCILLVAAFSLSAASAATLYWDGTATAVNSQSDNASTSSQNWLSGGNWDNGSASTPLASWTAGNAAVFGGTAASQTIIAGAITVGNLTFGQGPLGAGTAGTSYTITGGTLTLSNSTITANTATVISSVLAGSKGFIKSGQGTLLLSGSNTLSGGIIISQGELRTGSNAAAGTGTITLGDANC